MTWVWDETLYRGSARHYTVGRVAYPDALAAALRDELGLDGTGRLLDVGCGPGALTLLLAPLFETVVGVDADQGMLDEGARVAAERGVTTVEWRRLRAEELPGGLGTFDVATFAQSFHWMDRESVARTVGAMLRPDGWWVHVGASTHKGEGDLPHWDAIGRLIEAYLGPGRRAGQGSLPSGTTPGGEEDIMRAAGFRGPRRIVVEQGEVTRSVDEIVSAVFSLSGSAPHLFGDRLGDFERDLRELLGTGSYAERMREIELVLWQPGSSG